MSDRDTQIKSLPSLAVHRPITMLMLFLSLLVVGAVAWHGIPLQLFPSGFNPPYLYVWVFYPNVSPSDNQQKIAEPVEEALWTVKGVKRIKTRISNRGSGHLLEFQQTADMDVAYLNIRDRLERIRPDLPDDLRYVYIWRYSEADDPILYLGISVVGNYEDPYRLVQEEFVKRLERVDGVAKVEIWGGNAKIIRIQFILDRLKAYNVDIMRTLRDLREADFALAGGIIHEGSKEVMVRVDGRLGGLEDVRNIPLPGTMLKLSDIAIVEYTEPTRGWIERIGRREAIEIGVFKTSDANTVDLAERLEELIGELELNPLLSGMQIDVLFDQGKYIRQSLKNLQEAGIWGALFAVMVLFFFLRRVRMTLFITLAIPLSLLATVTCLYFLGWSLNIITLSGLMISIGLVVDNAIVVVENIQTAHLSGKSPREAALTGASEVGLAITTATLTTAVVFLPMILMGGDRMLRFFMMRIGIPVVLALMFSLFVALMFIPLVVTKLSLSRGSRESPAINRATNLVEQLVRWTLNNRRDAALLFFLALSTTAVPMKAIVSTDQEQGNINDFRMHFRFPSYYTLADADSTMTRLEDFIYANEKSYDVKTVVTGFRRGSGRMRVFINDEPDRLWLVQGIRRIARKINLLKTEKMTRKEVTEDLKERFKPPPGVEMFTSWQTGRSDDAVYVSIYGNDTGKLLTIADEVKERLHSMPGVLSLEADLEPTADEIQIRFNRDITSRYEIDPAQTAAGLTSLIRGINLPAIRMGAHEIDGIAELLEADRSSLSQVLNLPVAGYGKGAMLTLGDVANVDYSRGVGEITRENRRTKVRIKISTTEEDLDRLSRDISASLEDLSLPPGYEWTKGERFTDVAEAAEERSNAWLLAIVFVFLLMGALFESVLIPWSVLLTIPFSFLGVWWMLFITGTQFGLMAAIGVIVLIGVVVNNAIVLVDRITRLRREGMERNEALILASKQRLRPIAMTALTTVMGLLPMAIGDANLIGLPYAPMGRAIIGGMLGATISTPLVVPLAYSYIDDAYIWFKQYVSTFQS